MASVDEKESSDEESHLASSSEEEEEEEPVAQESIFDYMFKRFQNGLGDLLLGAMKLGTSNYDAYQLLGQAILSYGMKDPTRAAIIGRWYWESKGFNLEKYDKKKK
jgi:hypothetical protein